MLKCHIDDTHGRSGREHIDCPLLMLYVNAYIFQALHIHLPYLSLLLPSNMLVSARAFYPVDIFLNPYLRSGLHTLWLWHMGYNCYVRNESSFLCKVSNTDHTRSMLTSLKEHRINISPQGNKRRIALPRNVLHRGYKSQRFAFLQRLLARLFRRIPRSKISGTY